MLVAVSIARRMATANAPAVAGLTDVTMELRLVPCRPAYESK
jgi:hypothetical protein